MTISRLAEYLVQVESAEGIYMLWPALKDFAAHLKFSHMAGICTSEQNPTLDAAFVFGDTPTVALPKSNPGIDLTQHPFILRAQKTDAPFLLSEVRGDPSFAGTFWVNLSAPIVRTGQGLIVPVHRGGYLVMGVNFAGENPDLSVLARSTLQVATYAVAEKYYALRHAKTDQRLIVLSQREKQCMKLVANGLDDSEIASKLGITPRTVRFHVDGAKVKLGAGTRVQAVTKALRDRIISIQ